MNYKGENMKYDLIIVGAGPSGIFTAFEFNRKMPGKKILLIEQGRAIEKRNCPKDKTRDCVNCQPYCNITTGFSGAGAFQLIFSSAFRPIAATGGFAGAALGQIIKMGFARGLFSNEAGMGSSPIIHSSAQVNHPVEQAIWGVAEVFIDTVIICTITAITIVVSGEWTTGVSGVALTMRAFNATLPGNIGSYVVLGSALLFGYSCLITVNYYCERAGEYLFGPKCIMPIRYLWIIFIVIGSVGGLEFVWSLADTANGLMAIPNLIGLIFLSSTVVNLKKEFLDDKKKTAENNIQ